MTLLNVFLGVSLKELGEGAEVRLCAANMRFCIAALDLCTGKLLTHTNHSYLFHGDSPVPKLILAAERARIMQNAVPWVLGNRFHQIDNISLENETTH